LAASPWRFLIQETGLWSLRALVVSLALGPLAASTGWRWPRRIRRMAGLFGAFYAALHVWAWARQYGYDWPFLANEMVARLFLAVGAISVLALAPMVATSFDAAHRRLGPVIWSRVHLLIYPTLTLALLHFYLSRHYGGVELAIEAAVVAAALALRFMPAPRRA
jgi:sulfoxide reductase heme-binding subunit YedZ